MPELNPVAHLFSAQLDQLEHDLLRLADVMPADGYDMRPPGAVGAQLRTFGEQVRHVTTLMRLTAAIVRGQAPPLAPGPGDNGPAEISGKAVVLDALRHAFTEARAAALSFDEANQFEPLRTVFGSQTRAEVMTALVAHSYDHYGQMVVYARLHGIIPPASEKSPERRAETNASS